MGERLLIEPTADERKNGWTPESLTQYVREREKARAINAGVVPPDFYNHGSRPVGLRNRPERCNNRYDPKKW